MRPPGSYGYSPEDFGMTIPWRSENCRFFSAHVYDAYGYIYIYIYGMVMNLGIEPFGVWRMCLAGGFKP